MTKISKSFGFTLVELNLAIIFVAVLLVAVATTIIGVSRTYEHGVALKSVNQTGREVIDQLRRDMAAAQAEQVSFKYVQGIGRLCLGSVSYVYNDAELLNGSGTKVQDQTKTGNPPITFARIADVGGVWCQTNASNVFIKSQIVTGDTYTEVLQTDIVPMAIHALEANVINKSDDASFPESLFQLQLTLGTNEVDTLDGDQCKPPTDPSQNFTNCAVREFVTVVRIVGGGNG